MGLLKALLFFAHIILVCGTAQRARNIFRNERIPDASRDGRPNCPLVMSLADNVPNCSLFISEGLDGSFFDSRDVLLCFGVYDTHFQLCKYNDTLTDINVPKYSIEEFCGRAKVAFEQYRFERVNTTIKSLATRLRSALTTEGNCTNLCIFEHTEINPKCKRIVSALEIYSDITKNSRLTKPAVSAVKTVIPPLVAETKSPSPPPGAVNPVLVDSKGNLSKSDAPAGEQKVLPGKQPSEQAQPSSLISKTPEAALISKTPEAALISKSPEAALISKTPEVALISKTPEVEMQRLEEPPEEPAEKSLASQNLEDDEEMSSTYIDPGLKESKDENPVSHEDSPKPIVDKYPEVGDPVILSRGIDDDEESNLVTYFILMTGGALLFYVAFHNKNKLLALALEGRRGNRRGGRHSSAAYSKLHSNLEEAIAAGPTSPSATHVLY